MNSSAPEPDEWDELITNAITFLKWALAGLIDGAFLVLWALTQWGVGRLLKMVPLQGIDAVLINVFQALFAAATVAPILFYVYRDITIAWMRTRRSIHKEQGKR